MSLETHGFEFGDFFLDVRERVLLRGGKPLSITPKAFQLLFTLVKKHGHLVEKSELMREVWADSFVEETNLAFTVRILRKALEDSSQNPRFIETVPRRGYRFIADVRKVPLDAEKAPEDAPNAPVKTGQNSAPPHRPALSFIPAAAAVLLVVTIALGGWLFLKSPAKANAPVLDAPFASEKLSTNGKVFYAALSPDGETVVYLVSSGERSSVWIRQLESGNNVEIIPPSDDVYFGLALSPDGNFLYFSRRAKGSDEQADIYRVSIFGGIPVRIVSGAQGWMSLSSDGRRISFVRCPYRDDEFCSLWTADAVSGGDEKMLVRRPRPLRIGDNKISPDGRSVAFAAGQSENAASEFGLWQVDVETGAERELSAEKFFNIRGLAWLPDQSGLLITASRIPNRHFRIWQVSARTGSAEPLTNDSETYSSLSLDKKANRLVSTQIKENFILRSFELENPSEKRVVADASSAAFAPDGRIFFSSGMSGNNEIWSIRPDGSGQKQLTNDPGNDTAPVISAGNKIFFASNRSGRVQVWRMNADGSDQTQVTDAEGGFPIFATNDGKWVYYHHGLDRTLWRAAADKTGLEQPVYDKPKYRFAVSPDGTRFAFSETQGAEKFILIVSIDDRRIIKKIKYSDLGARMPNLIWMPDGKSLAFVLADADFKNNSLWIQPVDGPAEARKITDLGDEGIFDAAGFSVSPDGRRFTVAQGGWFYDAVLFKGLR
jgi:Tol biopolymer transport system component/DNA-binding winged helix-turn-helix (wHTH) protein